MGRIKQYGKTITIQEACFYGFFILLSLAKGLGFYEGQKLFALLVAPALVLGFLKILLTPYTKRQAFFQILLLALTAVVYYESREIAILFLAFTVLGMKNISVKKVLHIALWVWTVCAVALSAVSFFFLEYTVYRVHAKMGLGHIFSLEPWLYPSEYSAYHVSDALRASDSEPGGAVRIQRLWYPYDRELSGVFILCQLYWIRHYACFADGGALCKISPPFLPFGEDDCQSGAACVSYFVLCAAILY